jgi:hypothetical protein
MELNSGPWGGFDFLKIENPLKHGNKNTVSCRSARFVLMVFAMNLIPCCKLAYYLRLVLQRSISRFGNSDRNQHRVYVRNMVQGIFIHIWVIL